MEARASFNGASVSKTFVAAILVLVALGLGAMGGYVAKGLSATGAAATQNSTVHAAPGSVLRQDNSSRPAAVHAAAGSVLRQDNSSRPAAEQSGDDGTGGVLWNRGGHKQLP